MPGFTSPPNPRQFNAQVWEVVRQIPVGKVATYGQIASLITPPTGMTPDDFRSLGARWVGGAMAACPEDVPWQRVVNSQGKISLPLNRGGTKQRMMLEEEGIEFDAKQRIDLKRFGWRPSD